MQQHSADTCRMDTHFKNTIKHWDSKNGSFWLQEDLSILHRLFVKQNDALNIEPQFMSLCCRVWKPRNDGGTITTHEEKKTPA